MNGMRAESEESSRRRGTVASTWRVRYPYRHPQWGSLVVGERTPIAARAVLMGLLAEIKG